MIILFIEVKLIFFLISIAHNRELLLFYTIICKKIIMILINNEICIFFMKSYFVKYKCQQIIIYFIKLTVNL